MLQLFRSFDQVEAATHSEASQDFYVLLCRMREAVETRNQPWSDYPTIVDYAQVCFWAIRKLEYSFAADALVQLERSAGRPLRVLDVGCGVVPFCNWVSKRGHDVTAIDPLDSDIEFLTRNNLNGFYGSKVDYRVGRSEEIEFPDATFDVVTCISVLEHIAPGNDRLGLWEVGRVLKSGGKLIVSFDVSPPPVPQPGQKPWPADRRRYAYPFSAPVAERLLDAISTVFDVSTTDVPGELRRLTWDDVHAFWQAAQAHDLRDEPLREYLAMGAVLERSARIFRVSFSDVAAGLLEGQQALEERAEFYATHAEQRMELVQELDEVGQVLREEVEEKDAAIVEKEQAIGELSEAAQERLSLIEQLHSRLSLQERIDALEASIDRVLEQVRTETAARHAAEIRLLRREKEMAEAAAAARLEVIEEQQRALQAFRKAHVRFRWRERFKKYFTPRIGVLYHYNPRPLVVPGWYTKTKPLTSPPRISIVTPTLNQGQFIERTLRSVLDQDYPKLEYIVQDACSQDETVEILTRYGSRLAEVVSERDRGLGDGLNRGLQRSTGEIMAYLNSDDVLLPGALNYVADYFERHPDVDVVYGHRVVIDEYDAEIGRWVLPGHDDAVLSWADFVPQETLFWRRGIWDKSGASIDDSFQFAVDWDLLLRFREAGAKMRRLPRFLGGFRVHPHQKTSAELLEVGAREMGRLRERALGRDVSDVEVEKALRPYLRRHFFVHKLYRMGLLRY